MSIHKRESSNRNVFQDYLVMDWFPKRYHAERKFAKALKGDKPDQNIRTGVVVFSILYGEYTG